MGPAVRAAMKTHRADYIPTHLVNTQKLYRQGVVKCDVAFIVVSPPDNKASFRWVETWYVLLVPWRQRRR